MPSEQHSLNASEDCNRSIDGDAGYKNERGTHVVCSDDKKYEEISLNGEEGHEEMGNSLINEEFIDKYNNKNRDQNYSPETECIKTDRIETECIETDASKIDKFNNKTDNNSDADKIDNKDVNNNIDAGKIDNNSDAGKIDNKDVNKNAESKNTENKNTESKNTESKNTDSNIADRITIRNILKTKGLVKIKCNKNDHSICA
ncbi:hypothetical protein ENBRE01_3449, partial [Enteropsectra breve]